MKHEELTGRVLGAAIEVHREVGPGLLESTYEQCLGHELRVRGVRFSIQVPIAVEYKGLKLDCGYRADFVIEDILVVELKSVEQIAKIHEAQLLTYMKHAKAEVGLLINFNVTVLKQGIKRYLL